MAFTIGTNDVQRGIAEQDAGWQVRATAALAQTGFEPAHRLGYVPRPGAPSLKESERIAAQLARTAATQGLAAATPAAFDWRAKDGKNYVTAIKDQGGCGSCVAFGVIAAVESMVRISTHNPAAPVNLSEAQLFFCYGPDAYAGACPAGGWWPDAALDALRQGVADESAYPYTDADQACRVNADWRAKVTRITGWRLLSTPAAIKRHLATVGPVTACFTAYEDLYFYGGGVYRHVTGEDVGGHCVCIVGYHDAGKYWIAKNSWGTSWGEHGFFRIGYGQCGIDDAMWSTDGVLVVTLRPWPSLKRGASGRAVRTAQHLLRFRKHPVTVDGDFGPKTEAAVRALQSSKGQPVDGVVGAKTWRALIGTVKRGSKGDAAQAVQEELKSRGHALAVDGDFGVGTEKAVKAYQKKVAQLSDGVVGPFTWQALSSGMS